MSLRQIAKQLGISPAYLSYTVNGKRPWREGLHERYRQLVNTPVNSIPVDVNSPKPSDSQPHEATIRNAYRSGGSGRESNPPTPCLTRHNGFEVLRNSDFVAMRGAASEYGQAWSTTQHYPNVSKVVSSGGLKICASTASATAFATSGMRCA